MPGEAQKIDRIISTFSQCYSEDNAGDLHNCPFQDQDTVFLVSFAIIMLNTDLNKSHVTKGKARKRMTKMEFITNLRGAYNGVDKFREYLFEIYDSIEQSPIAISNSPLQKKKEGDGEGPAISLSDQNDIASSVQAWLKGVKPAQELLRTVAARNCDEKPNEMSRDTVSLMFQSNWPHIHGTINAIIDNAHLDLGGLDCCAKVLEYCITTASYLNMPVERSAFSKLLGRVNRFNDLKVHSLTKDLNTSFFVDDEKVEAMKEVATRIRNGHILLNDPSRTFVKEGDLVKRHQLAGRSSTYRFFLFSDVLVYAHKSPQGDYKVHEEVRSL